MTLPRPPEGTEPGTLHWLKHGHRRTVARWHDAYGWERIGIMGKAQLSGWIYLEPVLLPGQNNGAETGLCGACGGQFPNPDCGQARNACEERKPTPCYPMASAPSAQPLDTTAAQAKVAAWVRTCFGDAAMSLHERGMRALEEMDEVAQSVGITRAEAHRLVDVVYDRPAGEPAQELGGTMLGLLALAKALGVNLGTVAEAEIARVHSKSADHFRQRQAEKAALGVSLKPGVVDK